MKFNRDDLLLLESYLSFDDDFINWDRTYERLLKDNLIEKEPEIIKLKSFEECKELYDKKIIDMGYFTEEKQEFIKNNQGKEFKVTLGFDLDCFEIIIKSRETDIALFIEDAIFLDRNCCIKIK